MSTLAKNLKNLRELHKYTQEYVAEFIGVSQNTYSVMERGETKITIERLESLASLYNMDITDVLKFNDTLVIHNISDNKGVAVCTNEVTINNSISDEERKLFQRILERLENNNERLLKIIEQLSADKNNLK